MFFEKTHTTGQDPRTLRPMMYNDLYPSRTIEKRELYLPYDEIVTDGQ